MEAAPEVAAVAVLAQEEEAMVAARAEVEAGAKGLIML